MTSKQELFKLFSEAHRLQNALKTADSLDDLFKQKVQSMLDGTGKPVTPDEARQFTK